MGRYEVTVSEGKITWAKDEVTAAVLKLTEEYNGAVYTEERIKQAKDDRATLRKLATEIDGERKRVKNLLLAPYEAFEKEVKEVLALIDTPVAQIDAQVKAFEQKQKDEKLAAIKAIYDHGDFKGVPFETLFDSKWLNATASLASIEKALAQKEKDIDAAFAVLESLGEYRYEATEVFWQTASLTAAMQKVKELKELAERKAEHEKKLRGEDVKEDVKEAPKEVQYDEFGLPIVEDTRVNVVIRAKVTKEQKSALEAWLAEKKIESEVHEV